MENKPFLKKQKENFYFTKILVFLLVVILGFTGVGLVLFSFLINIGAPTLASVYNNGAVATDTQICSEIGAQILQSGGNAVDAAIASGLCLGVVSPYASGIGGGGMMLIHIAANNSQDFIDFREIAPQNATFNMYDTFPNASSTFGGLAIGIPGEISGYYEAWSLYGNLSWSAIFQPAINLAKGFPCSKLLALRLIQLGTYLYQDPGLRSTFAPNGVPLTEGQTVVRQNLANILTSISLNGPSALYTGTVATNLANEIQNNGGIISAQDFASYKSIHRPLTSTYYKGLRVVTGSPPSSGNLINFMLNLIEKFNLNLLTSASTLAVHYMIESIKWAFGQRNAFGDISFVNITNFLQQLQSKDYSNIINQNFSPTQTYPAEFYLINTTGLTFDSGTSHLSVIDQYRNSVSLTLTVNLNFGSKFMSPSTGIIFNNQMDDFSTSLTKPNAFGLMQSINNMIVPGKRPMSSTTPLMIFNGRNILMSIGGSGGPTIISSVFEVIMDILEFQMDPKISVDSLRFHTQLFPRNVLMEPGFSPSIISGLTQMGENITLTKGVADGQSGIGCVQVIVNNGAQLLAASDIRKFGVPAGY